MRRLCLGGTFNPLHHGHLICVRAAAESLGFDQVLLIPAYVSPHKMTDFALVPAMHRLKMCQIATAGVRMFEVSDLEIKRTEPSYTIQTVRELKRLGFPEVNWLVGADQISALPRWHESEALLNEANLYVMARPGWSMDWEQLPPIYRSLKTRVVEAPLIDISATAIRARVKQGLPIDFLTPAPVVAYIKEHGLYRA